VTSTASATPTITATATDTETPSATPSDTPTPSNTPTPADTATVTPTAGQGWTFCADEGGTCNLPGGRIVRYGETSAYSVRFAVDTSIDCTDAVFGDPAYGQVKHCEYYIDTSSDAPLAIVVFDPGTDDPPQSVQLPPSDDTLCLSPAPPHECPCQAQDPSGGGCSVSGSLFADVDNVFDASASVDRRVADQSNANLSFEWKIFFPPTVAGGAPIGDQEGISGTLTPFLTIHANSLPDFGTSAGTDPFYRMSLTITENPLPDLMTPLQQTVVFFRFKYVGSQEIICGNPSPLVFVLCPAG
jgi:hypothetical protein